MLEQRLTQLHHVKLSKALFNSDVVESLRFLRLSVGEEAPAGMKPTGRLRSAAVDDRLVWRRDEPIEQRDAFAESQKRQAILDRVSCLLVASKNRIRASDQSHDAL